MIDGVYWDQAWPGPADPKRFASALLANLGASFAPPSTRVRRDTVPLSALKLVGESPYLGRADDQISCFNNATFETPFQCMRTGTYRIRLTARGTPLQGTLPRVQVLVDGKQVGLLQIQSIDDRSFATEPVKIGEGRHTLQLVYDNDASGPREDRNLFLRQVEFER